MLRRAELLPRAPPAPLPRDLEGPIDPAILDEESTLQPGTVVDGRYVIHRAIGRGASALVYKAVHRSLRTPLALKVTRGELLGLTSAKTLLERHRREAYVGSRVRSPYVPYVYEVGRLEEGSPYIAMELVGGESLCRVLERGPLPYSRALAVAEQLLSALDVVHRHGVVHRDVKPENVVLQYESTGDVCIKLLDFGICRFLEQPGPTLEGLVVGTPAYMPLEQMVGDPVDTRADLYAVGTVLYEMLTGLRPYGGATLDTLMRALESESLRPPSELCADCPAELDAVIARSLARTPSERFPTAYAMLEALRSVRAPEPGPRDAGALPAGGAFPAGGALPAGGASSARRLPASRPGREVRGPSRESVPAVAPGRGSVAREPGRAQSGKSQSGKPQSGKSRWVLVALVGAACGALGHLAAGVLLPAWPPADRPSNEAVTAPAREPLPGAVDAGADMRPPKQALGRKAPAAEPLHRDATAP